VIWPSESTVNDKAGNPQKPTAVAPAQRDPVMVTAVLPVAARRPD
jgi:hypothetical protein